jgi:hypothetical protein
MKIDEIKVPRKHDQRIKLNDSERELIRILNSVGWSQRKLATRFRVSRRLIQFILSPDQLVENKLRREERGGSKIYYTTEYNTKARRKHRQYKRNLIEQGIINTPEKHH